MTKTPQRLPEACPHEVRPGTTVCLHCRHTERLAARERRKRYMLRSSVVGVVVATLGTAGVLGAMVIRSYARAPERVRQATRPSPAETPARVAEVAPSQPSTAERGVAGTPPASSAVSSGNVAIAPTAMKTMTRAPIAPVLPEGRSDLPDGISAMRTDSVVVLSFDTKLARTRIPEKFERFVRATLPTIYGASADSALARIPQGALARQGDLINDMPARGMRVPVSTGWTITLYPQTRPGQDGPLVTRYRVLVVKG